jgi:hypothetical protein
VAGGAPGTRVKTCLLFAVRDHFTTCRKIVVSNQAGCRSSDTPLIRDLEGVGNLVPKDMICTFGHGASPFLDRRERAFSCWAQSPCR